MITQPQAHTKAEMVKAKLIGNSTATFLERRIQSRWQINGYVVNTETRYYPDRTAPYQSAFILTLSDGSRREGMAPLPAESLDQAEELALRHALITIKEENI